MKILHAADLHLGAYVGPQCDDPMKRMENTIRCLDVLVETAMKEQPDLILIAGDIWQTAKIWSERSNVELRIAAQYIDKLRLCAPVAVLYGTPNHDSTEMFNNLSFMCMNDGNKYPVYFFGEPELCVIKTKSGPIQVAGLPGFDKGHFRAQFPGMSAEEENKLFTEMLSTCVQGLSAQVDTTIPSVLMAHHTVVGCELDNGTHVFQANEVVLDAATLDNSAFDLVCLGHIHKAQALQGHSTSKPVFYSGSIDANNFNDEGHNHGFWIHSNPCDFDRWQSVFIKTPAREFLTLSWDQEQVALYNSMSNAFTSINFEGQVVRILYTCDSETEKALDKKKLERDLYAAGAYYVSEIRPEKITSSVNREGMTEKLTVWDCLRRYLTEKKVENMSDILMIADDIASIAEASQPMGTTSGMFLPVVIEVRNYRSYAEEKLSFEDIFFAMVNGKNGSGKSSLFMDAITDCLYEETREKELTGWIRNGEKSGSISFTFRLGEDIWRVTRTRQRSGKGTLALAKYNMGFLTQSGDEWFDKSCDLMKDTQNKIVDLLGMDCDTFQSCVLIMQDRYGKFMEASKEDRMAVLANLLGLGIYDELEKLAKDRLTDANREVKVLKTEIEKLEGEVKFEEDLYTEKSQVEVSLAVSTDDLKAAREELVGYQTQLASMDGYVREASGLEMDLRVKTDSYSGKKDKKADLERRVSDTIVFLRDEQNILDKCAELDSTRLEIAALDGKVQLLNDKRKQSDKVSRELLTTKQQWRATEVRLDFINKNIQDREKLEKVVEGNTVEADLEECEKKAQEYRNLDNALTVTKGQLIFHAEKKVSDIGSRNYKLKTLLKQIEMLDDSNCIDVEKAGCRFLQSAKQAQNETKLLKDEMEKIISDGNEKGLEIDKSVQNFQAQIESVGYDGSLHSMLLQEVRTYREAKDRLSKIAADSATADELKKQDVELVGKIEEYEQELGKMDLEIVFLEQETGKHFVLKSRVNVLLQYEEMKMQLPKAKQFVESTVEVIGQLEADIVELVSAIARSNERLVELKRLTEGRDKIKSNILITEDLIGDHETYVSSLNQQIGTINAKLEAINEQKFVLFTKQSDLRIEAKQAALLTVLVEAFSQDGIPYQIIRDIVPELESAANEILGQMTGGRMRLEFVTEKVLKSNKAKEIATLEIIIIDVDNGILPYLSRSGGQKVRAALANSFALAMIKATRVGLQLGMLFIDEPSFLDADGIEGYCAALETIHNKYPEMRILAISHDENMKSRFPQQLRVDITENGSRVRKV